MRLLIFFLLPLLVYGQDLVDRADPPLLFHEEPLYRVADEIQNKWLTGDQAIEREIKRNQRLLRQHQFPLVKSLLYFAAGIALAFIMVYWKMIASFAKNRLLQPPAPEKVSKQKLKKLEKLESLSERYWHLGTVVREYIQNQYRISAVNQTNEELLSKVSDTFDREQKKNLNHLFNEIERVVYAGNKPKEEEYVETLRRAETIIKM